MGQLCLSTNSSHALRCINTRPGVTQTDRILAFKSSPSGGEIVSNLALSIVWGDIWQLSSEEGILGVAGKPKIGCRTRLKGGRLHSFSITL